ncbi:HK97 family phage prohead protease [Rhizobium leguminosarum]|uniref:HK97 family phage prohead protease n=1 Tax=Rhizobium leguminosarum TaxID=384 RepID=UPI0024A8F81E|nr:HK97 family phage prohead protease [Rhizobium leguminosarum]MDI5926456.1 HK97 family phage prohead protease [Rhizobium leguminosarum]
MANSPGTFVELDTKAIAEDGTFTGYASVFGVKDRGRDVVMPGAFKKSLATYPASKVKMLLQHDTREPVGVWLKFEEDAKGLKATGKLILETVKGRETYELMKAGAYDSLSIGYRTVRDELDRKQGARLLHEVELREVSIVTFAMNEAATISAVKQQATSFSELVAAINDTTRKIKESK